MKKIIIGLLALSLFLSVSAEEDSFDLGNKTLQGVDKREFQSDVDLLELKDEKIINDSIELKISEEDLDSLSNPFVDDIEVNEIISDDELRYNIVLSQPNVVMKDNQVLSDNKNTLILGAGYFENLDSFYYLLDFNKSENNVSYAITLNRDIRGEDKNNSDLLLDSLSGKVWSGKYYLSIEHNILNEKFPGIETASLPVTTYKDEKNTELNFQYDAYQNEKSSLKVNTDIKTEFLNSPDTPLRDYDLRSYTLGLDYQTEHSIESLNQSLNFSLLAEQESFLNKSSNDIRLMLNDSLIWSKLKATEFNFDLGVQSYQGEKSESNFYFESNALRVVNSKFNLSLNLKYDSFAKSNSDILNGSKYDDDILPISYTKDNLNVISAVESINTLNTEKTTVLELAGEYNIEKIYLSPKLRYVNSQNKLIYAEEEEDVITNEIPLEVSNYDGNLSWFELELYGSYIYNENYKADLTYIYNSLDKISFNPNSDLKLNLIYENSLYRADLELQTISKMYGDINKSREIKNSSVINIYNNFKINNNINASINILNLFNKENYKKTEYLTDARKLELRVKILF